MIYEDCCSNRVVACALTIPLEKSGWLNLIEGQLEESKVEGHHIFNPNKKPNSVGLHIYHVEVLDSRIRQFYTRFLTDINAALAKLRESIHVIGLSAYCVTEAGNGLFEKKLGCRESGRSTEYIFKSLSQNQLFLTQIADRNTLDKQLLNPDLQLVTRCRMLVTHVGDGSLVWNYIKYFTQQ